MEDLIIPYVEEVWSEKPDPKIMPHCVRDNTN